MPNVHYKKNIKGSQTVRSNNFKTTTKISSIYKQSTAICFRTLIHDYHIVTVMFENNALALCRNPLNKSTQTCF